MPDSAGRVTVGVFAERWLEGKKALKESTWTSLDSAWRSHVRERWGEVPVGKITRASVQQWVASGFPARELKNGQSKAVSATVIIRAHGVLAGILDLAVDERLDAVNRARGVQLPRKTRGMHAYLSWAQLQRLVDECGPRDDFVLFLAMTGLRWGEPVALQGKHVDRKRRRVTIERAYAQIGSRYVLGAPKSHERRSVPVPAEVLEHMPLVLPEVHVWRPGTADEPLPRTTRGGWFEQAVARCMAVDEHIPRVSPHDLRHTAASLAVSSGANVKALQRMLGHASAAITLDQYADLFDDDLDDVAHRLDATLARFWPNRSASSQA